MGLEELFGDCCGKAGLIVDGQNADDRSRRERPVIQLSRWKHVCVLEKVVVIWWRCQFRHVFV